MSFKNVTISVLLAIIFTWFALANSDVVTVSILLRSYKISLSLVILICILIGIIIAGLISAAEQTRMLGRIHELEKQISPAEKKK